MQYKYITDNNLKHTQKYMYTQYGGTDFLAAYLQSRQPFLTDDISGLPMKVFAAIQEASGNLPDTTARLTDIYQKLQDDTIGPDKDQIDLFIRRFEVRKRLFLEYDPQTQRPIEQSGYDDILGYMLLSAICEEAYHVFHSLKYLNCFLKLNDTLISIAPVMTTQQRLLLQSLVAEELRYITDLASRKGVAVKEVGSNGTV